MKTVWILENGVFSDRHVVGIFSTKEKAEKVVSVLSLRDASYTETSIDTILKAIDQGLYPFFVVMLKDGTVETCDIQERSEYSMETRSFFWDRNNAIAYKGKGIQNALNATVLAKSKKHAIKTANEIRARMIASGEWEE